MVGLKKFQEGMSSDDIEEKLKYVRQVIDVAKELGRDETINTLIPFLNGIIVACGLKNRLVSRKRRRSPH